jgi:hypothetical protein
MNIKTVKLGLLLKKSYLIISGRLDGKCRRFL